MKPSAKIILAALRRGEVLTPLVSLHRYGIHALSQRISEIRNEPCVEAIISEQVNGDKFHRYFMPKYCRVVTSPPQMEVTSVKAHVRMREITTDDQLGLFA